MPGIPTLFRALELTLDELDKQNMHHISDVMRANPGYAHLGVIGASIGDFLPADPPAPGAEPLTNYTRIWKNIFQLLADLEGRKGFISTLTGVRDSLNKLATIATDEDAEALVDLQDSGEADQMKATADNLKVLVQELIFKAKLIAGWIAKDLRPVVNTAAATDPIPATAKWQARDVLHWRKTGAFVRNLLDKANATGDARLRAYAFGYLVGYTCMVCGSPFINSIVGGPFRTQWWRQRFIRVHIDAWVYGYYEQTPRPTMGPADVPSPPYDWWPTLCDANLQRKLNLGPTDAMDPIAALNLVVTAQPFPAVVPDDFAQRWFEVVQATFGAAMPEGLSAASLNGAYCMTWLMLWFQTSGVVLGVLGCRPKEPQPPGNCGKDKSELDPFKADEFGNPTGPPPANIDEDVDETALTCAIIFGILGGLIPMSPSGTITTIITDEIKTGSVDWDNVRCKIYWNREYLHNAMAGFQRLVALTGFAYPDPKVFAEDAQALALLGSNKPLESARNLVKSRLRSPFPSRPWITLKPDEDPTASLVLLKIFDEFEKDPDATKPGFETPGTTAYHAEAFPSFFLDDPGNPLGISPVKRGGPGLFAGHGAEDTPARFGSVVANAIDLFRDIDTRFPNWNLDADRGLAWLTWKFKTGYDPGAVDVEPEA
ncbi:MAG TPA: hypothetical protein VFX14_23210 [Methylomirabilota bacterium]|nr:hypothetical protein [Methylomirabilota bacterium]